MNRIKYENYLGAAGYDAVARKKIKELEEKVGTGGGSGGGTAENVLYEAHGVSVEPDDNGYYIIDMSGYFPLVVDRSYFVNFNGNSFICKAAYLDPLYPTNGIYIGNYHMINDRYPNTGENFCITSNYGQTFLGSKDSISDVKISTSGTAVVLEANNLQMQYVKGLWETVLSSNGFRFEIGHTYLVEIDGRQNKASGRYYINDDGSFEARYVGDLQLAEQTFGPTFEGFFINSAGDDQFIIKTIHEAHSIKISEVIEGFNPASVVFDIPPQGNATCNLSYFEVWDLLHRKVVPVFLNKYGNMGDDLRANQYVPASLVMIPDFIAMGMQFIFPGPDGNNITIGYTSDGTIIW